MPTVEQIVYWHWQKARFGPALTGNESWRHFLAFLESELAAAGVVDFERNRWTFDRWQTSHWPDDSRWSLTVGGDAVRVASFGANSGSTGPEGVTAPLVLYEPGDPPEKLTGKIAVMRTRFDPAIAAQLAEADYEYRAATGKKQEAGGGESVSWRIFPQLMQTRELIAAARAGRAAGLLLVFDANRALAAGLYTFPVPALYDVPTLILDREAGGDVVRAAEAGRSATLRLEADVVESEAYQLIGFLPGRRYGTPEDEVIQLVTHTDGPAISQDNGALGLLALIHRFADVPRSERPRTLMVYLDCRHFMPGQEEAFAEQDYFARHPELRDRVVAVVGMEHLGQIEYAERGDRLVPTGRVDQSLIWTTDDPRLLELAIAAVKTNDLPSAVVRNVARPGVHGRSQGAWYGLASPARIGGKPAVAIMGTMGGYWGTSAGIERLDPELFRRQVAVFAELTRELMTLDTLRRTEVR
ncbi:MAG TPA: hypothetical protein VF210_06355 [Pseudomonadales bacterium]